EAEVTGAEIWRTDEHGTLTITWDANGDPVASGERSPRGSQRRGSRASPPRSAPRSRPARPRRWGQSLPKRSSVPCVIPHVQQTRQGGSMASEDEEYEAGADSGSLSRRSFLALSGAAAASVVLPGMDIAAAAAQGCKPFLTPPDYLGIVPTTTQVLGF